QASGYASTYYPSTPNPAEAQRVAVAVGQELASVDIQLQPVKLAKGSGGAGSTSYPWTPNPAEAQRVAVAVGQELASVDIQLQPVKLAKVSGVAIGSDGKPTAGAMVMLVPSRRAACRF